MDKTRMLSRNRVLPHWLTSSVTATATATSARCASLQWGSSTVIEVCDCKTRVGEKRKKERATNSTQTLAVRLGWMYPTFWPECFVLWYSTVGRVESGIEEGRNSFPGTLAGTGSFQLCGEKAVVLSSVRNELIYWYLTKLRTNLRQKPSSEVMIRLAYSHSQQYNNCVTKLNPKYRCVFPWNIHNNWRSSSQLTC